MRLFWIVILIFVAVALVVAWAEMRSGSQAPRTASTSAETADAIVPPRSEDRSRSDAGDPTRPESDSGQPDESSRSAPGSWASASPPTAQSLAEELLASADQDRSEGDDGDVSLGEFFGGTPTPPGGPAGAPPGHVHEDTLRESENPWKDGEKSTIEHSIVKKDDGRLLVDGLFEINGSGTPDDPYEVSWELLMSAAETYQPRLGMTEIPERIQMLDNAHVRITGHLLFPMIGADAKEMLLMLNMWDGCCLGTMPSPYDAIEVQLTETPSPDVRRFSNYGAIEGIMRIDPYLINDWLIGLYLMEEATLRVGL
ncbi:MAG: hypothetical protein EA377_05575 [Phycisphaerales bacterium]|nr:MAG: hypothetical protein EA377_05575 [Phycisphaerales bacterium]